MRLDFIFIVSLRADICQMMVVLQMCICAHFKQYSHLSKDPLAWVAREYTKWKHLSIDMPSRVLMREGMSMYKIFSPALFFTSLGCI